MNFRSLMTSFILFLSLSFTSYAIAANYYNTKPDVTASTPADDAAITATLKQLLENSKTLKKYNIQVNTKNGVVVLQGTLDSDTQWESVIERAQSIIGVADINAAGLKIKDGTQPMADALITAKVKGLLIREDLFGEKDIASIDTNVETKEGIVYISGNVDNQTQIDNAIEIIKKSLPEVKAVEYHVKKFVPNQ